MDLEEAVGLSSELTEIKLTDEEPGGDKKTPAKTNTLKRLFKLPTKRVSEALLQSKEKDGQSELAPSAPTTEAGDANANGGEGAAVKENKEKRFHLRLGSVHRQRSLFGAKPKSSSDTVTDRDSKTGLKNSFSNYWNSIFKRSHAGDKIAEGVIPDIEPDDDDDEDDISQKEVQEDVQQLAISDEPEEIKES